MKLGHERLKEHKEMLDIENLEEVMDSMQELTLDLQEAQGALARDGMLDGILDADTQAEFAKLRGDNVGVPIIRAGVQDEFEAEFQRLAAETGFSGTSKVVAAQAARRERQWP